MKYFKTILFFLSLCFFSCASRIPVIESPIEPPKPEEYYLTIIAAGDNLVHEPILKASYNEGVYSFDSIYARIKGYISPADIAMVNQETILGNKTIGYSGYPLFSTPREAGSALVGSGFNIINHANNHIMDKGEAGIFSSIEYWDSQPAIHYLGIFRSEDERNNSKVIINKNNISVGFLAYTSGTNGIGLPKDKSYLVAIAEKEKMSEEINALRPFCDFLVVSMHWGEEYRSGFTKNQENLAAFLAELKVDLVIGHHPHVLEPYAEMLRPDGKNMIIFYSLGNFLSAHFRPPLDALLGGLAYVKLKKKGGETIAVETGLIPVITHYDVKQSFFNVYPLSEYSSELAEKHWKHSNDREMKLEYFIEKAKNLFGPSLIMDNPFRQ